MNTEKTFSMSKYASKADLFEAKAEYFETMYNLSKEKRGDDDCKLIEDVLLAANKAMTLIMNDAHRGITAEVQDLAYATGNRFDEMARVLGRAAKRGDLGDVFNGKN